ncbi:MAG: PEP-utilizing enzyme [Candidatus Altiarchaeota archaeon]
MKTDIDPEDVKAFIAVERLFAGNMLVAAKNENSELVEKVKPCNMEFFERVFNGLIWELYAQQGLAYRPYGSKYMAFLNHEMFFCKNVEQRFMALVGPERGYSFKDGRILDKTPLTAANVILSIAKPVEMVRNALSLSVAALRINDGLSSLPEHHRKALAFWEGHDIVSADDVPAVASEALEGASASMRFSLMAAAAASYGIRLKDSSTLSLVARLQDEAGRMDAKEFRKKHGYFSARPYDVSKPFLDEDPTQASLLLKMPAPTQLHYIVREDAKLCCGMHLAVLRRCYLAFAKMTGLGEDVFFLYPSELKERHDGLASLCEARRRKYECASHLPMKVAFKGGAPMFEAAPVSEVSGVSAGARSSVSGRLVVIESFDDPVQISAGDVIASRHLSPELVVYYCLCSAVISETGGRLAHAAIVALEKNIPCVVQVEGFDLLKTGMRVSVDGATGKITVLGPI